MDGKYWALYGSIDMMLDRFPRMSQLDTTPRARRVCHALPSARACWMQSGACNAIYNARSTLCDWLVGWFL